MGLVGDGLKAANANWSFGGEVAEGFDEHVSRSVPFYNEGHELVCALSDFFIKRDSVVYEVGCSTGALTCKLAEHNKAKADARFVGIDIEPEMVARAEKRKAGLKLKSAAFVVDDILIHDYEPADMIVAYYTIQFVRPSARQAFIDRLYQSLHWGGALVMFEKVRGPDARFQDIATTLYADYKLQQGYTPEEIVSKTRSLKGVLEPFSTEGNLGLLQRAGFVDVMTVMKYVCFEGFLAIK